MADTHGRARAERRERRHRDRRRSGGRYLFALGTALLFAGLCAFPAAAATSIHVDQANAACSDTGPGSETTPHCTIGAGVARAGSGDSVLVAPGVYEEQVTIPRSGTATSPIVVTALEGAMVTVRGRASGFRVDSKSWVTIRGFHVADTTSHGIYVTGSTAITVEDNDVSGAGAQISGQTARGISLTTTSASVVRANATHDNSDAGIFLGAGSTDGLVDGNTSAGNARGISRAAAGIDIRAARATVSDNVASNNEDSGINVWDGATGGLVYNNVVYGNGDHGIDDKSSNDVRIIANTVYDSVDSGIEVVNSTGVVVANNIAVDNGIDSPRTEGNLRVDAASAATITADHDLVHLSAPGVMIDWSGTSYSSLTAFRAAVRNQESHGVAGDPRFVAPTVGDLRLRAGSPAIDSANSGVAGQPRTDALGRTRVDDPATSNSGTGPRPFDDRGAFEFLSSPK